MQLGSWISTAYYIYIHELELMKLFFAVLYVSRTIRLTCCYKTNIYIQCNRCVADRKFCIPGIGNFACKKTMVHTLRVRQRITSGKKFIKLSITQLHILRFCYNSAHWRIAGPGGFGEMQDGTASTLDMRIFLPFPLPFGSNKCIATTISKLSQVRQFSWDTLSFLWIARSRKLDNKASERHLLGSDKLDKFREFMASASANTQQTLLTHCNFMQLQPNFALGVSAHHQHTALQRHMLLLFSWVTLSILW